MPVGPDWLLRWQSVPGRSNVLERRIDLTEPTDFQPLATGLPGQTGTTTFLDTNTAAGARSFYRVEVQE